MKKNSLYNIFTAKKENNEKSAIVHTDFKGFFISFGRKFWNLSNLNLLFTLCNFPILFLLFTTPSTPIYVFIGIAVLTALTFGLSNAGMAYIIRAYNRAEPVFMFSDFFSAIKRNIKQAMFIGLIDVFFVFVLVWDVFFWSAQEGYLNGIFYYLSLFLVLIYFMMRFYIYTLMITFKLSIYKIFKNSFIFSLLGIKRNILGLIGIVFVLYINYFLASVYIPLGIILPFIITISICYFISGYTSYPVIKKYMIDPYYSDNEENPNEDDGEEKVFVDRG